MICKGVDVILNTNRLKSNEENHDNYHNCYTRSRNKARFFNENENSCKNDKSSNHEHDKSANGSPFLNLKDVLAANGLRNCTNDVIHKNTTFEVLGIKDNEIIHETRRCKNRAVSKQVFAMDWISKKNAVTAAT